MVSHDEGYRTPGVSTSKTSCHRLTFKPNQLPISTEEPELRTDHEEADTRLIFHARHAGAPHSTVVIESSDTDVAVMALAHSKNLNCQVALLTGTKDKKRLLDIKKMVGKLGENVADSLIGVHAFSGRDAVSSFASKGKKTHYKLIKSDAQCQQAMKALGESFEPTDHLYSLCEAYTCKLYGQEDGDDINKLRYKLFITKSGASQSLPPCRESLRQHINRANFVAAVWKQADTGTISPPPPTCHGWILDSYEEDYSIRWHDVRPS